MRFRIAVCLFLVAFANLAGSQEMIIESRQGGKNASWYSEIKGNWADSIAKSLAEGCSPETIGSRFVTAETPVDAEARFSPEIRSPGKYEILVTWGRSGNVYHVKYVVFDGKKETVKYLDQAGWGGALQPNSFQWFSLGTYDLPAGKKAYVSVQASEVTGKPSDVNGGRMYTDAVLFAPPNIAERYKSAPPRTPLISISTPSSTPASSSREASPFSSFSQPKKSPFVPFVPVSTPRPVTSTGSPFSRSAGPTPAPVFPYNTGSIQWYNDYGQAIQAGSAAKKSILLFFASSMGRNSRNMEDEILGDPRIKAFLAKNYIACRLNIGSSRKLCDYYSVFKAPVIIFLDSRGYSRARIDTLLTVDQMLTELEKFK